MKCVHFVAHASCRHSPSFACGFLRGTPCQQSPRINPDAEHMVCYVDHCAFLALYAHSKCMTFLLNVHVICQLKPKKYLQCCCILSLFGHAHHLAWLTYHIHTMLLGNRLVTTGHSHLSQQLFRTGLPACTVEDEDFILMMETFDKRLTIPKRTKINNLADKI